MTKENKKLNPTKNQRNVLFLLIDDLRVDKCWGDNRTNKTPTIDLLSEKGTVFTQAISVSSTTTPNVASILTGNYAFTHGIRSIMGYELDPDVKTLAEVFKENGYNTYAEVTGPLLPESGLNRGFDEYQYRDVAYDVYSQWGEHLVKRFKNKEFKEPWFVFIHFWEMHYPRRIPDESKSNVHFFRSVDRNLYETALTCLDMYIKKLLKNLDENAVIIFHADHGEKIAETMIQKYLFGLGNLLWLLKKQLGLKRKGDILPTVGHGFHIKEYLVRVPLIFVGKKVFPENRMISDQVSQIDVFPTVVDALGLSISDEIRFQGRSLMPLIRNERIPEIPVFSEACGHHLGDKKRWFVGIRTSKYKFFYSPYNDKFSEQLYDLENDPAEKRNIINEKRDIAQKLKETFEAARKKAEKKWKKHVYSSDEKKKIEEKLRRLGYI